MTIRRPPLDLRELLTVRIIARAGSIHGAARMMGGKQSAISRSLRLLEERLGVPLFRRTSGGTRLTQAGTAFLQEAELLLDGTTALYERTRRWSHGDNGIISVGLQGSLPPSIRERIAVVEVIDGDGFSHFAYGAAWQRETCPPAAKKVIRFLEQQAAAF